MHPFLECQPPLTPTPNTQAELRGIFTEHETLLRKATRELEHWTAKIGELELPDFDMCV